MPSTRKVGSSSRALTDGSDKTSKRCFSTTIRDQTVRSKKPTEAEPTKWNSGWTPKSM